MKKNAILTIKGGQRVSTSNPGGGGWGNPYEREAESVATDVRNGYVSIEAALKEYGVEIRIADLSINYEATRKLRAARA